MTSDYDKIREDNIREYGQGTRHLAFLGKLYSNRTHFIYELLQNAEDEGAKRVLFILHEDCLIFLHDGKPFDELDVRGICGVGEGDKADDLTKIGTFGIGFKSVYAYTSRPEIHSGEEHFCIEDYVRPYSIEIENIQAGWTTSFLFPFDENKVNHEIAYADIANRLKHLSVRTLLFINNIQEIIWQTAKVENGEYIKETKNFEDLREVTVIGKAEKGENEAESWLIFSRNIEMPDGTIARPVEIAYKLGKDKKSKKDIIIPVVESPLVVFFPTEKESHLGFMVQGPYRTTPARDNIPNDDDWNRRLVMETSCLVISSLVKLRDLGMLDVQTLETLPIRADNFPNDHMFNPMFEHVKTELLSKDLIPGLRGKFISGKVAKIGRISELRNLLKPSQLRELYDADMDYHWISGRVSLDRTPDLRTYLMEELDIDEIIPVSFARLITEKFLANQTDEWMIRFYKFLLGQEALWKNRYSGVLRSKPFIRLEDNSHVEPFDEDDQIRIYFPVEGNNTLNIIKSDLLIDDDAKEFFVRLGVSEPDIVAEVVEKVLPLYDKDYRVINISDKDNLKHVSSIVRALKIDSASKRSQLISKLKKLSFLVGYRASNNERVYCTHGELYIKSEILALYFDGNEDAFFIGEQYSKKTLNALNGLGLSSEVYVSVSEPNNKGYVVVTNWHGYHRRGLNGFDPAISIDGLEHALSQPTVVKSLFIWNELVIPYKNHIQGITERSNRKTYEDAEKSLGRSLDFGYLLHKYSWLPNETGKFFKPSDIKITELDKRFDRDPKVASQLEMQDSELVQFADSAGLNLEDVELVRNLKENPELLMHVRKTIEQFRKKAEFPERTSKNSEHRRKKKIEKIKSAPKKEYKTKEQSRRTSKIEIDAQTQLRNYYTNQDGELVCQMCHQVMPFKKRDGDYYMEAVEITSFYDNESEDLFIALCPTCAAKYKEFVKRLDGKEKEMILSIHEADEPIIEIKLGDDSEEIKLVDIHFQDLKTLIKELGTP
jgi:hypothetical protein